MNRPDARASIRRAGAEPPRPSVRFKGGTQGSSLTMVLNHSGATTRHLGGSAHSLRSAAEGGGRQYARTQTDEACCREDGSTRGARDAGNRLVAGGAAERLGTDRPAAHQVLRLHRARYRRVWPLAGRSPAVAPEERWARRVPVGALRSPPRGSCSTAGARHASKSRTWDVPISRDARFRTARFHKRTDSEAEAPLRTTVTPCS